MPLTLSMRSHEQKAEYLRQLFDEVNFEDVGLRNARLGFRQIEVNHIMENVIYSELCMRGYSVDVGMVEERGKTHAAKRPGCQWVC